ncbi:MAG TPA: aminotransferase class IV [Niabella sp.]|nr:aminotransferase class IV [Niabella sp.]HOZ96638.1 aminotransferase class IV [Niabella sp.]HQW14494.1 aminotransferase class IV [Niabella sp.]HQX19909.1 aminotransferase class IV [Niabella sp.]HQX41516.1 aminotransferase class IV [Niabella sp.]
MALICFNGNFLDESRPILRSSNRGYRYGDGFFETIRIVNNSIPLIAYHQKRIEKSIKQLGYTIPENLSLEKILLDILELCKQNDCTKAARVRLSFFNGHGGLYETNQVLSYLIEVVPLISPLPFMNIEGLRLIVFSDAKKDCSSLSNIKTSSALLLSQAARFAIQTGYDDCLILNFKENPCESSIANIFWIKNQVIYTPPLSEGCVDGVLRAWLLDQWPDIRESPSRFEDLWNADEVFLTNAIRGIQWIKQIESKEYSNSITKQVFKQSILPLFEGAI